MEKEAPGISFYALPEGRRLGGIDLDAQPHEVVMDVAGRFAYVAQYGVPKWAGPGVGGHRVYIIDLASRQLLRVIDRSPFNRLHGIRLDGQGRLYVLSESESSLIRFDNPATDLYPSQVIPLGGVRSHYFVIRRDGQRAYIADSLSGMVIMANPFDPVQPPVRHLAGRGPEGCALSLDEQTFYVLNRYDGTLLALDAMTLEEKRRTDTRGEAVRIITLGDGRLLVSNDTDRSLNLLDPVSLEEQRYLPMPSPVPGLNLHPEGRLLFAATDDGRIIRVDLERWEILGEFATRAAPDTAVVIRS